MDKDKIKKFVKDHKCEFIALGVGVIVGGFAVRQFDKAQLKPFVKNLNYMLMKEFADVEGNFTDGKGSWNVLQLVKE